VLCSRMRAAPGCCAAVEQLPGLLPGLRHVMLRESSTYAAAVCACDAVRALEGGQPAVSGDTEGRGGHHNPTGKAVCTAGPAAPDIVGVLHGLFVCRECAETRAASATRQTLL
jgi:hypothetical protein